jgi:hypothetical protein
MAHALVSVGIDVAQMNDRTAVAATLFYGPTHTLTGHIKHLERLPEGQPYPEQARRLANILHNLKNVLYAERIHTQRLYVLVDVTGVGRPIFDMLTEDLAGNVRAVAVTLTGGSEVSKRGDEWHIPKQHLVSALTRFMVERRLAPPEDETGRLTDEARQFQKELRQFQGKKTAADRVETGARQGAHDDLVISVGLSLLPVLQSPRPTRVRRATVARDTVDAWQPANNLPKYRGQKLYVNSQTGETTFR